MVCDLNVSPIMLSSNTLNPASPSLQWVALGTTSPPSHLTFLLRHRYYDPLRLPEVRPGLVRFSLSAPGTFGASFSDARDGLKPPHLAGSLSCTDGNLLTVCSKETSGSPEFPNYLFDYMTWSQTPVVSLAAYHFNAVRTAAFRQTKNVGFPLPKQGYPYGPQLYNFRGSIQTLHS